MEEEEVQIGSYKRETTHGLRNPTSKGSENTHTWSYRYTAEMDLEGNIYTLKTLVFHNHLA